MHKKLIAQNSENLIKNILTDLANKHNIDEKILILAFTRLKTDTDESSDIIARLTFILNEIPQIIDEIKLQGPDYLVDLARNPKGVFLEYLSKNPSCPYNLAGLETIYKLIRESNGFGTLPDLTVIRTLHEMKWWIVDIGLPEDYLAKYSLGAIAQHILVNRLYEIEAKVANGSVDTFIKGFSNGETLYIGSNSSSRKIEEEISKNYEGKSYYVSVYKTNAKDVIFYIVKEESPLTIEANTYSCNENVSKEMTKKYLDILEKQKNSLTPIVDISDKSETKEKRIMVSFPNSSVLIFKHFESILNKYGITVNSKYFHNISSENRSIYTLYVPESCAENIQKNLSELSRDISNLMICPTNQFSDLLNKGFTLDQVLIANTIAQFVHFFSTKNYPEISEPKNILEQKNKAASALQQKLDNSEFPIENIINTLIKYPEMTKLLSSIFMANTNPANEKTDITSQIELLDTFINDEANVNILENERLIFSFAKIFINNVIRSNFYMPEKAALSFRMNPDFLNECRYEESPFGVFFVVGKNFEAFHTRFKDIARGGIRLVISRSLEAFHKNLDDAYREGFGLARTQQSKNKDIAEGGSKGIIIANYGLSKKDSTAAFKQYIDALLDLILPQNANYINNFQEEILFLGPDENTADLMDWACERAKERGYTFWKSFTTGKSPELGGVSHIDYGMTTTSVHEFTKLLLKEININEQEVKKLQTGGPDGDLGSNEILISRDKTTAIVDGAGVLYDPKGINREELTRLALLRQDISNFDTSKLSENGFRVLISDKNITLPSGEKVKYGESFRNLFHLHPLSTTELFVPCGGRPRSINMSNVNQLLIDGKPKHQLIVEGANLFLTQEAREFLEAKGVKIIKDSSANKGGVTSSSYEVLVGLALSDSEFTELMLAKQTHDIKGFRQKNIDKMTLESMNDENFSLDRLIENAGHEGEVPEFRKKYIGDIIQIIKNNARLEFTALWKAHTETGKGLTVLSDILSNRINTLSSQLDKSELFENIEFRRKVLLSYIPKSLSAEIGINTLMDRIPLNYQKAIFCKELARLFVYTKGIDATPEDYRAFIQNF